jgi:Novel toxin 15
MALSSKTHQERKTTSPASGLGGGRVLPFKPDMGDREAFGEAMQMKREAQNPHMKAGAIPQRMNTLARKGELEHPEEKADTTATDQGKQFASSEPPPLQRGPAQGNGGGDGKTPSGKQGHIRTDVASIQSYSRSKNVGQELGSNADKHIGYQRLVEMDVDDGRRIKVKVQGRTALDALHGSQDPSLDAQGMSQVWVEIEVVGDYGKKSVIQADATGAEGDATMHSLIQQLAAEQGIPPGLLLPGTADDSYVQQAITVADRVQPAALRPAMEPSERLAEPEATPEKAELKDWETMSMDERRAEAWDKFKEEFSWEEVATAIYVGAVTMFVMTKAPIFALIAGTMLAEAAIAYGVYDLVASLVEGKSIELSQFLKDGLLIVGGALAIVCTFAILMKAPGAAAMAGFAALMAAIAYVITEAIMAHFQYEEAVASHSRDEMQRLATEAAKNAQGAIADGVLVLPALKSLPTLLKEMTKPTMGAPGEEGVAGRRKNRASSSPEEETKVLQGSEGGVTTNPLGLPAIKRLKIKFKASGKHDAAEFARQLQAQEDALNRMTVEEWLQNRDRYLNEGRSPEGGKAQKAFRENELQRKMDEIIAENPEMTDQEAMAAAKKWMENQAALHDPDQVAGGFPDKITGLGDKGVNSSIGAQWATSPNGSSRSRVELLDDQVRSLASSLSAEERKTTFLNIELDK